MTVESPAASSFLRPRARTVQLLLLTLMATALACARTALGPLQEAVRIALPLTDNQLALLQGSALSLPALLLAIPLGMLIDRYSRVRLLLAFMLLGLVGGIGSAVAPGFITLFAARCLVGLAMSASAIATLSLLADLYTPSQRGRATMFVTIGQLVGMSGAFALGGALLAAMDAGAEGWRSAMLLLAVPVLPLLLAVVLLRELPRTEPPSEKSSGRRSFVELWRLRAVIGPLLAGYILIGAAGAAIGSWGASALSRSFGLSPERVGAIMGMALLIGGLAGPFLGGVLADLCQRAGGPRRTMAVLSGLACSSASVIAFAFASNVASTSVLLVLFMMMGGAMGVTATALLIVVIPGALRGLCLSVSFAALAIFDGVLAPLSVSVLSGAMGGSAMMGKSLTVFCLVASLLGAAAFALGSRRFPRQEVKNGSH